MIEASIRQMKLFLFWNVARRPEKPERPETYPVEFPAFLAFSTCSLRKLLV
jgi:hypothetical protein